MAESDIDDARRPVRTILAGHYAIAAASLLIGIIAFVWVLDATGDRGVALTGFVAGSVVLAVAAGVGVFVFYRALGLVLPAADLDLDRPEDPGHFRRLDLLRSVWRGDPDEVAEYLDELRGVDPTDVRPWQPGADVPDEVGQAAYEQAKELREATRRTLTWRFGFAVVVVVGMLAATRIGERSLELAFGSLTAAVVTVALLVGAPMLAILSAFPATVRDWTAWYRDHVVEA